MTRPSDHRPHPRPSASAASPGVPRRRSRTRLAARARRALLALMPLIALSALGCPPGDRPEAANAAEGAPAPEFRLATLDGRELGPQDFEGEVVLVEFWATWCVPCHAQAAVLKPLYEDYRGRGVEFLAVDLGEDEETVRRFVADNPFPYPVLLDPDDELSYELGVAALPTLMVIDRGGEVVYFRPGVLDDDEVRDLLARAGAEAA